jgi:hypothetical protein
MFGSVCNISSPAVCNSSRPGYRSGAKYNSQSLPISGNIV